MEAGEAAREQQGKKAEDDKDDIDGDRAGQGSTNGHCIGFSRKL